MNARNALYSLLAVTTAILGVTTAQAASVYVLDRSDALADGVGYLQIEISDGANGAIDFKITPLQGLLDRAGKSLEIRSFAFNIADGVKLKAANIANLPNKWVARSTSRQGGFGRFDMTLFANGPKRTGSLSFSIVGIEGDTPFSYVDLATGKAKDGQALFAARVRDLVKVGSNRAIPTAFVGGGAAIPIPAAGWLAGVAAVAASFFARRRRVQSL